MDLTVLTCACGQKVNAPGARPGRVGRCPRCGRRLEVPEVPPRGAVKTVVRKPSTTVNGSRVVQETGEDAGVEGVAPPGDPPGDQRAMHSRPTPAETLYVAPRTASNPYRPGAVAREPTSGGFSPLETPEAGLIGSLLYPLRGAEGVAMASSLGIVFWGATVLVPEYCLAIWSDANTLPGRAPGALTF